ncbi:hypothetical protein [Streptomyces sp. NPDC053560]|uniref:hypothetical protein n=1 Tax=Streptomyces sp. NPDC053560 TaxID=3365711 RepID=UPI0037D5D0C8
MTTLDRTPDPGSPSSFIAPNAPAPQPPGGEAPLMPLRTFVLLISALGIGTVVGVLTAMGGTAPTGAVLAGLAAGGAVLVGLHKLIGG